MTPREAQELVRMVESNWMCDFGERGRELWRKLLEPYDAELATRAIAELAKMPLPGNRARPTVADLRGVIVRLRRIEYDTSAWREGLPSGPLARPEWVSRWTRARAAGDHRPFPEQVPGFREIPVALPPEPVTDRDVWVQADEYLEQDQVA